MRQQLFLKTIALIACLVCSMNARALEAYASFDPETNTLTFRYDNARGTRSGITYDLNWNNDYPGWYTDGTCSLVEHVVFVSAFHNARPSTTHSWFEGMENLQSIRGLDYLNTQDVTNMSEMFSQCQCESLDLHSFNTSQVTTMNRMFYGCSSLTSLDVSSFNTEKVTDMESMFGDCNGLQSFDLSNFNTSNVTNMAGMFSGCSSIQFLDLSSFNTSNVTRMDDMFSGCSHLVDLYLKSFNTSNVTDMSMMFSECTEVATIFVGPEWSTASVVNSDRMFYDCIFIRGGMGTVFDYEHQDAAYAHIDLGTLDPGYLTDAYEAYMVYTPDNHTITFYHDDQKDNHDVVYELNPIGMEPPWNPSNGNDFAREVWNVVFDPSFAGARPTSTYKWFYNMIYLSSITGLNYLNTSEVRSMGYMFYRCWSLPSLDLSNFDTSKVTDMSFMFYYCSGMTSLDVSSFDTDNVTSMASMFYHCVSLPSLDVSSFRTPQVISMNSMFYQCSGIETLDLDGFTTENVRNLGWMFADCYSLKRLELTRFSNTYVQSLNDLFYNCGSLEHLDLSGFGTNNVTNMMNLFYGCGNLKTLDLSTFDTRNVSYMIGMFYACSNLATIYVGDNWSVDNVYNSAEMFLYCDSIRGCKGTTYDVNHIDCSYAHVDGGENNPGYFSDHSAPPIIIVPGDVNNDGRLSITDVTALIGYLLSGDASSVNINNADVNNDSRITIADVTALINILLSSE